MNIARLSRIRHALAWELRPALYNISGSEVVNRPPDQFLLSFPSIFGYLTCPEI
jgi:hypothetical protein